MKHHKKYLTVALGLFLAVGSTAGCSKISEPNQDAPVGERQTDPADIISMPDGFSNLATVCNHGNRVYVAFKGDGDRAAIAVVPKDPSCAN